MIKKLALSNGGKISVISLQIFTRNLLDESNFQEIIQLFYPVELKLASLCENLLYSIIRTPQLIHIPDTKLVELGVHYQRFLLFNLSISTNDLIGFIFDQASIGQRKIDYFSGYGQDFTRNYLKVTFKKIESSARKILKKSQEKF